MSDLEIINNFIKQLPKLNEVVNKLKEQSEGDVVKKLEINKQIEMTNEMKNMKYEELKGCLEKKYDKLNFIQANKENENKERDECFKTINKGIEIINQLKQMTENIHDIKEYDSINMNNINIMINKIVDMMIDNENQEHKQRIKEINKLKKQTTTNEIIDIKEGLENKKITKKLNNRGNNEYIYNNLKTLETWSGHQVNTVLYDSDIDGKDSSIFRNKIMNHNQLYFIIIDSNNNVFGHYHSGVINKINSRIHDSNIFIFTLNSNGRCGIKKFKLKSNEYEHSVYIYNDNRFYCCGNGNNCYCDIHSIGNNNDSYICDMSNSYEDINKTDLIGVDTGSS